MAENGWFSRWRKKDPERKNNDSERVRLWELIGQKGRFVTNEVLNWLDSPRIGNTFFDDESTMHAHPQEEVDLKELAEKLKNVLDANARNIALAAVLWTTHLHPGSAEAAELLRKSQPTANTEALAESEREVRRILDSLAAREQESEHLLKKHVAPVFAQKLGIDAANFRCLVDNIYHEARGESKQGQKAVMAVTLNRYLQKLFAPKIERLGRRLENDTLSLCGIVYERKQFSWTLDPALIQAPKDPRALSQIEKLVSEALGEDSSIESAATLLQMQLGITHDTLFYINTDFFRNPHSKISPQSLRFFRSLEEVGTFGRHTFFRMPRKK